MSTRLQYLKVLGETFAAGAAAALAVNAAWFAVTGDLPSLLTSLIAAEAVTVAWSIGQAIRWRRKWQAVLATYERPALGEGIDTPHRPPLDDEQAGGAA